MLNNVQEEWKPVEGFENLYQVSNLGRISNYRIILKPRKINSGYFTTCLTLNGYKTYKLIHRLVATAFITNEAKKREVNHIDGNKTNNSVVNLEWVTSSENKLHARDTGLKVYNIPTLGLKLSTVSKYHNVGYDKSRSKWNAAVRLEGKSYYQKRFNTEEEAALHVNWILDKLELFDRPRNIVPLNA